jgi:putative phage-type endonuclease
MEQRTEEWFKARLGKVTASRVKDVLANGRKGEPSKTREAYLTQIACERLTGLPQPSYSNDATEWGTEQEPHARLELEFSTELSVEEVGLIDHPVIPFFAASPDGRVRGMSRGVEIKCPFNSAVHLNTLRRGVPPEHLPQLQAQMACADFDGVYFVSFDPRMPEHLRLFCSLVLRDESYIQGTLLPGVRAFNAEVEQLISELDQFKSSKE